MDHEKMLLHNQMKELEEFAEDFKQLKSKYDMKLMWQRWLFTAAIRKIKNRAFELRPQAVDEVEQRMTLR